MLRISILTSICLILTIVGAVNWGLVGFFNFDLVAALLGDMTMAARAVYGLVGIAGIVLLILWITGRTSTPAGVETR